MEERKAQKVKSISKRGRETDGEEEREKITSNNKKQRTVRMRVCIGRGKRTMYVYLVGEAFINSQ